MLLQLGQRISFPPRWQTGRAYGPCTLPLRKAKSPAAWNLQGFSGTGI